MRPDRSSRGQRARRSRRPPLAGPTAPGSTGAINGHATGKAVIFGPFRFLPAQRMLLEGDKPLPLGSRALDILNLLLERPGEVIRKDEIIARVWPNIFVDETVVRTHVSALRKVLGDNKRTKRYISNVPGRGYVFVARVPPEPATARPTKQPAGLPRRPKSARRSTESRRRLRAWWGATMSFLSWPAFFRGAGS